MATFEIIKIAWLYNLIEIDFLPIRICPLDLDTRAFQTRPFRRTRTQTEVRNSDSDSDLRNRDFPTPLNKNQIQIIDTRHKASIWDIFGSDQTTGCPRNHMKTFSNIDYSHSMYLYENLSGKCITRPEFWNQVISSWYYNILVVNVHVVSRKKVLEEHSVFSNCHIIGLDTVSLVFLVSVFYLINYRF
jgi:hypothetical protein